MVIATIGSGHVGGALSSLWRAAGFDVRVADRTNTADVAKGCQVLALCIPWPAVNNALASCGDLTGKILIDCTNPINKNFDGLAIGGTTSAAEQIQALQPSASVIKAFNSIGSGLLGQAAFGNTVADGFYCGDSDQSKDVVRPLIAATGLRPVDVGPLRNARYLEAMAMLWIDLAVNQKRGPTFAFTLAGWEGAK
jgi:8-hydroxy-5-deazaflavin:NADPH oxidoreductase